MRSELERAAQLCTCPGDDGFCDRACTTCAMPTWSAQARCVKSLWANMLDAMGGDTFTVEHTPPGQPILQYPVLNVEPLVDMARKALPPDKIEEAIDWLEANGMPLVPWQAYMFRAIMSHDGPVEFRNYRSR